MTRSISCFSSWHTEALRCYTSSICVEAFLILWSMRQASTSFSKTETLTSCKRLKRLRLKVTVCFASRRQAWKTRSRATSSATSNEERSKVTCTPWSDTTCRKTTTVKVASQLSLKLYTMLGLPQPTKQTSLRSGQAKKCFWERSNGLSQFCHWLFSTMRTI